MDYPNVFTELNGINHTESIAAKRNAISNTPEPRPGIGFAMSAFPPSAAMVSAVRHIDLAPSGKVSNSLRAALIQETGRVVLVIRT
jgi:hypothetical protein